MALERITPPNLADRIKRATWNVFWLLFFRPSPVPLHSWRCMLLRLWGAKVGSHVHPYPSARVWAPWNLIMEDGSCLGAQSDCYNVALVTLGRDCVVSQKAYLCTASHDIRDAQFPLTGAPVTVGERAWVAADAFIGPGVTVGAGAVVGARAVVHCDVEPAAIVAGNPANRIGTRPENGFPRSVEP